MLDDKRFYAHFGGEVGEDEVLEFANRQVFIRNDRLFVVSLDHRQDPFAWMSAELDSVVFTSKSGYLAIMVLFDSEADETAQAIEIANQLIDMKH